MSSRPYIINRTSTTEPVGQQLGDEWFDPVTNRLYKQLAAGGNTVVTGQVLAAVSGNVVTVANISTTGTISGIGSGITGLALAGPLAGNLNGNGFGLGNSSFVSVIGNIDTGNINVPNGVCSVVGNVRATNLISTATISATGNVNISAALGVGTTTYGNTGEIRATNNITAFFSSDARFKANVAPIANAMSIVTAVGGKTFDWTDEYIAAHGGEDTYFMSRADFGVIAQDLQQVFPRAVKTRADGTLAVDYEKLVAVAFQAIVELQQEIDQLKQGR